MVTRLNTITAAGECGLQLNEDPENEVENEGTKVRIIHEKSDKSTKSQHLAVVVQLC